MLTQNRQAIPEKLNFYIVRMLLLIRLKVSELFKILHWDRALLIMPIGGGLSLPNCYNNGDKFTIFCKLTNGKYFGLENGHMASYLRIYHL